MRSRALSLRGLWPLAPICILSLGACGARGRVDLVDSPSPPDGADASIGAPGPDAHGTPPPDTPVGPGVDPSTCPYADDATFCACMGWDCGGATIQGIKGANGKNVTVYCG